MAGSKPSQRIEECLFAQAEMLPSAPALFWRDAFISYAELAHRVRRVAAHLREEGVQAGVIVGVCMPPSIELVVALWAVFAAGAAFLPLDETLSDERLRWILRDAKVGNLLTHPATEARFKKWQGKDIFCGMTNGAMNFAVDAVANSAVDVPEIKLLPIAEWAEESVDEWWIEAFQEWLNEGFDSYDENLDVSPEPQASSKAEVGHEVGNVTNIEACIDADPDALAYVIYTSGAVGHPQAVAMRHVDLISQHTHAEAWSPVQPHARAVLVGSMPFETSLAQIFLPLIHGGSLLILDDEVARSPRRFWAALHKTEVTVLDITSSLLSALLDEPPGKLQLQRLMLRGETLSAAVAKQLQNLWPHCVIVNACQPAEAVSIRASAQHLVSTF